MPKHLNVLLDLPLPLLRGCDAFCPCAERCVAWCMPTVWARRQPILMML